MKCNRKQLADILGRDVKTIDKMVEQGMPYVSRPGENDAREWVFESADAIGWIVGEDKALDDALLAARARYAAAEAGLKELEYDYRRGFMMYEDEFRAMWQQDLQTVKSLLLAMPARMGRLCRHRI
jgi:phage terminase Nu1 subunit (DNA packaging protein)